MSRMVELKDGTLVVYYVFNYLYKSSVLVFKPMYGIHCITGSSMGFQEWEE